MLKVGNASLYFETQGAGSPVVFLHAGVVDSRQWNNEFNRFSVGHQVVRYDMRGYGKSEPVEGDYSNLADFTALMDHLDFGEPAVLVGCSMGGGIAIDYTLSRPEHVRGIVLVDSAPNGLRLDVAEPEIFARIEQAEEAGDLALACELEVQVWFDGSRPKDDVNPEMRKLAYDMNWLAFQHDKKGLGERKTNLDYPAIDKVSEIEVPVLGVLGENDIPYMHEAMIWMADHFPDFKRVLIHKAGHLPNMDHPEEFAAILQSFLDSLNQ